LAAFTKSVNDVEVVSRITGRKQKCVIWSMVVELREGKKTHEFKNSLFVRKCFHGN